MTTTATDLPARVIELEAELLAPGGPFETEEVDVGGERMRVFKQRVHDLREIVHASTRFGEAEYLVFSDGTSDRRFSFARHERLVASTAAVLGEEYGIGPGDRVAILGANSPEWIVAFWAIVSLGAVAVGLNAWWTGPEIRYGLHDSEPKLLIVDARRLARLEGTDPGVPTVVMEGGFDALWHAQPRRPLPDQPIAEADPAVILYTSGTTGRPKGAINTHRNVGALLGLTSFHGRRTAMLHPPAPDAAPDCQLVTSPLFHVSGLHTAAVAYLLGGVRSVWTVGRFDPEVACRLIERERITGWSYTTTLLHRLVSYPGLADHDLSSLRQLGGGGSPLSRGLQGRAKEALPRVAETMGLGYGQTECSALATLNTGDELARFPDSAGRPLPTVELQIRDERGQVLPEGEEGEICVRGPIVMPGYWRRPEATAEVMYPGRWLRTGDIGRVEGGRLYLATRKRDLILRGGENVYPVEIEQRLEEHPGVEEAAVIGVDHEELGQEVAAIVVPRAGVDTLAPDVLERWCAEALAYYKVPTRWEVRREPLPRNAAGKVLKHVLVEGGAPAFVEE